MKRSFSVSPLLLALNSACAQGVLFHNGHICTADSAGRFASYLIVEDCRITEMGMEPVQDRFASLTERVDLGGATVKPGSRPHRRYSTFDAFLVARLNFASCAA